MKWLACAFLIFGAIDLAAAVEYEYSGVAVVYSSQRGAPIPTVIRRADDPKRFRSAMTYVWYLAGGTILPGVLILAWLRRQESLDPFSENFGGKSAIDDLGRALDKEEESRKRLLPP